MNVLELFAGAGGGILGGLLLGHRPVCAVEIDPYRRGVLLQRQRDGVLPMFPLWDDVQTFNGRPWRGLVDLVSGGFPCQDISPAGKRAGIEGERSGLWREFARVVREIRPEYVFVENHPDLTARGLGCVLGDLATLGYDAEWDVFGACHVGARHERARIWILAYTNDPGQLAVTEHDEVAGSSAPRDTNQAGCDPWIQRAKTRAYGEAWWSSEPALDRVAYGVADRVGQVGALGDGQVPAVHALAFRVLHARLMEAR